jgi:putative transport protein
MYFYQVLNSLLIPLFFVFLIAGLGYAVGAIKIKGISLGTAGVLLVAILVGVLFSYVPSVTIAGKTITFYGDKQSSVFSTMSDIGTCCSLRRLA